MRHNNGTSYAFRWRRPKSFDHPSRDPSVCRRSRRAGEAKRQCWSSSGTGPVKKWFPRGPRHDLLLDTERHRMSKVKEHTFVIASEVYLDRLCPSKGIPNILHGILYTWYNAEYRDALRIVHTPSEDFDVSAIFAATLHAISLTTLSLTARVLDSYYCGRVKTWRHPISKRPLTGRTWSLTSTTFACSIFTWKTRLPYIIDSHMIYFVGR